jgi:hypothetical protein
VEGLFLLANDVLGGVVTAISPSAINEAVNVINNAFDECRILVGTIPYYDQSLTKKQFIAQSNIAKPKELAETNLLKVIAYPNPYKNRFQLQITSPLSGIAKIEFFTVNGQRVHGISKPVIANSNIVVPYNGPLRFATLAYKVSVGDKVVSGFVLKPN